MGHLLWGAGIHCRASGGMYMPRASPFYPPRRGR